MTVTDDSGRSRTEEIVLGEDRRSKIVLLDFHATAQINFLCLTGFARELITA